MLDRMMLSMKNGWLDAQNRAYIYYSMESIMEDLGKPDIIYVKNLPSGLLNEPYGRPCLGRVKITTPELSASYFKDHDIHDPGIMKIMTPES